jgi:acetyl esterase/lipase
MSILVSMRRALPAAVVLMSLLAAAPAWGDESGVLVRRALVYRVAGGSRPLRLDLYRPQTPGAGRSPAMVWIHGGGFVGGSRGDMEGYATALAQRGWTAVSIDYRLTTPSGLRRRGYVPEITAARQDAQAAIRWVRRHAAGLGVDPARIFVGGYSAGAVTSLYAAEFSGGPASRVAGVVSIAGGGAIDAIDRHDPPALMFHGTRDGSVPFSWARQTCTAYHQAGARCRLVVFPGAGHEIAGTKFDTIVATTVRWAAAPR